MKCPKCGGPREYREYGDIEEGTYEMLPTEHDLEECVEHLKDRLDTLVKFLGLNV